MAILKFKEIAKMNETDIKNKIKELRLEMIKSKVAVKKGGKSNPGEMRRTIAKLLTKISMDKKKTGGKK